MALNFFVSFVQHYIDKSRFGLFIFIIAQFLIVWLYHCLSGLPLMDIWETSSLTVMNNGIFNHVVHSLDSCGDRPSSITIVVMETHTHCCRCWQTAEQYTWIEMIWTEISGVSTPGGINSLCSDKDRSFPIGSFNYHFPDSTNISTYF